MMSCGNDTHNSENVETDNTRAEMVQVIDDMRNDALATEGEMDREKSRKLLKKYVAFANTYPTDSLTPDFLYEAGALQINLGKHRQAIQMYENIHDGFPGYDRKIESAYLVAVIYQNYLNDRIRAREYYEKVIELYPESEWAQAAANSLITVDMTEDQLIEFLKQQNQQD